MDISKIDPWGEENWNDSSVDLKDLVGSTFLSFDRKDKVFYSHGRFEDETSIKLEFNNCILKFDGFLFEHNKPLVNKKVQYIFDQETLGFVAMMQVDYCDLRRVDYRQAYIGMGNFEIGKLEMLIVYRNAELIKK